VYAIALVQDEATDVHWQELPDVPMELENPSAAVVDNYIFVIGGYRPDEIAPDTAIYEDSVHRYDVTTNVWDSVASMPEGRNFQASCGMDGKVYVMGGYADPANPQIAWEMYIYDVAADAWESGPVMPSGRSEHEAVCDPNNDRVYVMGGITDDGAETVINNDMVVYDVTAGTWSTGTPMNYYHYDFVAVMPDNNTIMVAGNSYDMPGARWTETYSISGDTWTYLDDLSVVRGTAAGGVLEDGRFCIAGGFNTSAANGREDTFECFDDPYWIPQIPLLNVARNNMAYATQSGQIYAIAGDFVDESGTEPVLALSGAFERYPHSPIPDGSTDAVEDDVVEDVPTDGDAADVPTDRPPDSIPDTIGDTPTDGTTDAEEEGDGGDEGCGCHMVY
jgi:N-acetylneuraminic acid mutarotase